MDSSAFLDSGESYVSRITQHLNLRHLYDNDQPRRWILVHFWILVDRMFVHCSWIVWAMGFENDHSEVDSNALLDSSGC